MGSQGVAVEGTDMMRWLRRSLPPRRVHPERPDANWPTLARASEDVKQRVAGAVRKTTEVHDEWARDTGNPVENVIFPGQRRGEPV